MSVRTIEHKISAGNQFDGTVPTTTLVRESDMERYPVDAQGGLFDFELENPALVRQIVVSFGGQSAWALSLIDIDAVSVELLTGTNEAQLVSTLQLGGLILLQGQTLSLTTTGASTAMVARVTLEDL